MAIVSLSLRELRRLGLSAADLGLDEPKRSKFNAERVQLDGITFHSGKEANRYAVLKLMLRTHEISDLELQAPYPIYVAIFSAEGEVTGLAAVTAWLADFRYRTRRGTIVVEDAKGFRTRMYLMKKKAVEAQYGIRITEV